MKNAVDFYESTAWENIACGAMHPGGLALTRHLLELTQLKPPACILDIGCGRGLSVQLLAQCGYQAVGVDLSAELIAAGLQRVPELDLRQGDAAALPVDGPFDAVLMECIQSLLETEAVLKECRRVLKNDGWLMLSDLYDQKPGPFFLRTWCERLTGAGFICRVLEDRRQDLRQFWAAMVWNGLEAGIESCIKNRKIQQPGYFALTAQKRKGAEYGKRLSRLPAPGKSVDASRSGNDLDGKDVPRARPFPNSNLERAGL